MNSPAWLEAVNDHATLALQVPDVVHELNNVLNIIEAHADLLTQAPESSATVLKRAETIRHQAERAAALLSHVQHLARASHETALIVLEEVVERAIALRRHAIQRAQIDLRLEPFVGTTRLHASPRRLLQTVLNLVMGREPAVAFQPNAYLALRVSRANDHACLIIEDSGPEVSNLALLDLGMFVARALVEPEGGTLEVTRRPGGGLLTKLTLPLCGVDAA